jgi:tetratricopeptide (TPR) repeat protein
MILYKYRQNSPYTDQIFIEGKVWLAKSSSLNDPCECTLHSLAPEWVAEKVRVMKGAQMGGFLVGLPGMPLDPAAAEFAAKLNKIEDFEEKYQTFRRMFEARFSRRLSNPDLVFEQLEDQLKSVGVFSLSESAEDPLMWAHYAGNHEGVCLGFEVADGMPTSDRDRFIRVEYTDQVPKMPQEGFRQEVSFAIDENGRRVSTSRVSLTDDTIRAAIGTKSLSWEYEREWRYVESVSGKYSFPGPLVEIVFGLRCTPEQRQHYSDLSAAHLKNDVRVYEMRRIPDSLAFERVFLGVCTSKLPAIDQSAGGTLRFRDETSVAESHPAIQRRIESRQFAQALPEIDQALAQSPESFKLWRTKGVVLGHLLRHDEALECFERATELNPRFFSAWYHRAVSCTELQRYEDAISAYREAHRLNPSDPSTIFNLGCVFCHLGRLEEAKESLLAAEKAGHPRARDLLNDIQKASAEAGA